MELEFAFVAGREFSFVSAFAHHFDLPLVNDQVLIPPAMGSGYLKQVRLNNGVNLSLHHYRLRHPLRLKRLHSLPHESIIFRFSRNEALTRHYNQQISGEISASTHAVQVASSSLFAEESFPADTQISYLSLSVSPQNLLDLLSLDQVSHVRWNLLTGPRPFVLYEAITPEMNSILAQLTELDPSAPLANLRCKISVQELLYLLFGQLLIRIPTPTVTVRPADATKIVALAQALLADFSLPPHLPTLADQSGLSATKLKQLFRQAFGASVYEYYQVARMKEAARLLQYHTVAETGYILGFTNLSHFARLFEKHHAVKPKKYQAALGQVPGKEQGAKEDCY